MKLPGLEEMKITKTEEIEDSFLKDISNHYLYGKPGEPLDVPPD
ncbi:hypothetical protein [Oceanobacillus senegalensis]|nr:hypothetical protein [Oceanobacillus senegalensis]